MNKLFEKAMARAQAKGRKKRAAKLDKTRQLTQHPSRYLTGLEPSAEILDDWDWNLMPFKWRGVDLDRFKQECEEIDRG